MIGTNLCYKPLVLKWTQHPFRANQYFWVKHFHVFFSTCKR